MTQRIDFEFLGFGREMARVSGFGQFPLPRWELLRSPMWEAGLEDPGEWETDLQAYFYQVLERG